MKWNQSKTEGTVKSGNLIVGVDIAKRLHYARILFGDGRESAPFQFPNTREGFISFIQWIREAGGDACGESIVIGIESTGHYWKALAYFLDDLPWITLVTVNPAHVKKAKEIYDNSPRKTDSKDAAVIAMLIQMGRSQRLLLPRGEFAELRIYGKLREQKLVELGVQRNILHSQIDLVFPEYGGFFSKLEGKTSLYLLERYTTPERMCKLGLARLTTAVRKASRGSLNERHARKLLHAAESTIGVREGVDAVAMAIRQTAKGIRRILKEIETIESQLKLILGKIEYAEHLLSIRGIGLTTLATVLGETGDLRRYRKAEEVIKLAGLNLYEISSGQHRGRRRISKRGRPLLRKILFLAAVRLVKTDGLLRADYMRLTEQNHMQKTKALVALSRKILRVLFALARDGVGYQEGRELIAQAA